MQMSTTHSFFDQYCISHKTISYRAAAAPGREVRRECYITYFSALPLLATNPAGDATAATSSIGHTLNVVLGFPCCFIHFPPTTKADFTTILQCYNFSGNRPYLCNKNYQNYVAFFFKKTVLVNDSDITQNNTCMIDSDNFDVEFHYSEIGRKRQSTRRSSGSVL